MKILYPEGVEPTGSPPRDVSAHLPHAILEIKSFVTVPKSYEEIIKHIQNTESPVTPGYNYPLTNQEIEYLIEQVKEEWHPIEEEVLKEP